MRHLFIILFVGLSSITVAQQPIERLFNSGEKAFQEKNYGLAVNYFSQCIAKDKNYMAAYWYRGLAYFYQNATQEALKDINKALSLSKSNDKNSQQTLYSIRAQIHSHTANYSDAINDYSKALSISPKDLGNLWGRALGYWNTGEYHKALKDFEECEKLIEKHDKDNLSKLYMLMAGIYAATNKKEEAIEYYSKSINEKKENNEAFIYRGDLYFYMEAFGKAIDDYAAALNIVKTDDSKTKEYLYTQRAQSYMEIGEYEKAINDIDQAISLSPNYYQYIVRGEANRLAGRYKIAVIDFSKSIEIEPDNSLAYYRRGWSKEFDRNYDEALIDYNTSIEFSPDYSYIYICIEVG